MDFFKSRRGVEYTAVVHSNDCCSEHPRVVERSRRDGSDKKYFLPETVNGLEHTITSLQGRRDYQEDRHRVMYAPCPSVDGFFGVFDGHSGWMASQYCAQFLSEAIFSERHLPFIHNNNIPAAIQLGFEMMEQEILEHSKQMEHDAGTTVVCAIVSQRKIYVGNTGDSRCVLARMSESGIRAFDLSNDHKPGRADERERIEARGGQVVSVSHTTTYCCFFSREEPGTLRVQPGGLSLSRSLGDLSVKEPPLGFPHGLIVPDCEITVTDMDDSCRFLVLGSDGIWDVLSSQDAVDFVWQKLNEGKPFLEVSDLLCQHAIQSGSQDNVTSMIVFFTHW